MTCSLKKKVNICGIRALLGKFTHSDISGTSLLFVALLDKSVSILLYLDLRSFSERV